MPDVTKNDIYLEHRCATCNGQVIIIPTHGLFLQHEDADSEADHSVTQITERGTTWRPPATFHPPMKDSDRRIGHA